MLCRILCAVSLAVLVVVAMSGCDNRPKIVLPTKQAPPPPRPHVAGGGEPAQPAAPAEEPNKKDAETNKPSANPAPSNDKQ